MKLFVVGTLKLERICKHESSSKSVKVVANIHVSLQFCGKAALKRRITLSYKYRASEASEGKIHFVPFFHPKISIVGLIGNFTTLLVINQCFSLLIDIFYGLNGQILQLENQ